MFETEKKKVKPVEALCEDPEAVESPNKTI
jgi:hypothetical protein